MGNEQVPTPFAAAGAGDDARSNSTARSAGSPDSASAAADPGTGIAPAAFRAPPGTLLGRVRFQVADLERSLAFYRDLLGFRVLAQDGAMVALGVRAEQKRAAGGPASDDALEAPGTRVADSAPDTPLIELVERHGAAPVPPRGRLGLFHVAILLPDRPSLGRILAHLAGAGVRLGSADHLVSEALYLNDPDGLGLEIYADRPRSAWRTNGREIAMATEPLAARDLVAAGGNEPWSGMPAGTRVGHIHFSVDDLATAEAFFHAGLGLDKIVWSYPGALFLSAGGYHHHVGANTWARGAAVAGAGDARLVAWRLVLPDADAVSAALRSAADAGFASSVDRSGHRITDPWGTVVRLDTHA